MKKLVFAAAAAAVLGTAVPAPAQSVSIGVDSGIIVTAVTSWFASARICVRAPIVW